MNTTLKSIKLQKGSLAEHLYDTTSLLELTNRLAAGPTEYELRFYDLTEREWQVQVQLAIDAIAKD